MIPRLLHLTADTLAFGERQLRSVASASNDVGNGLRMLAYLIGPDDEE